ncbi:MAG TPA: nucleotidyltransferase family protein, partial [Gemmatimonadaceae bacterium]
WRHGITPLVARQLARPAVASFVPPIILQKLRAQFDENALRNLMLARQLIEAVGALESAGIPAIPIKGPVLAVSAYGDLSLRQFGDLDVVVARRDFARARAALATHGFEPAMSLAPGPDAAFLGADYHIPLVSQHAGVSLELHWALARAGWGALRDERWPWRHARHVRLLGRDVTALSAEPLLVYLCAHASKHLWANIRWVCDVTAVVHSEPQLDWDVAASLARRTGADRMLALGLELARGLLGLAADTGLAPADGSVRVLARAVCEGLWIDKRRSIRDVVAFQCRVRSRPTDVIAYCLNLATAPQPTDLDAVVLPRGLRALYYLLRPIRLARKYARP